MARVERQLAGVAAAQAGTKVARSYRARWWRATPHVRRSALRQRSLRWTPQKDRTYRFGLPRCWRPHPWRTLFRAALATLYRSCATVGMEEAATLLAKPTRHSPPSCAPLADANPRRSRTRTKQQRIPYRESRETWSTSSATTALPAASAPAALSAKATAILLPCPATQVRTNHDVLLFESFVTTQCS